MQLKRHGESDVSTRPDIRPPSRQLKGVLSWEAGATRKLRR
jgi:hypothetical protein